MVFFSWRVSFDPRKVYLFVVIKNSGQRIMLRIKRMFHSCKTHNRARGSATATTTFSFKAYCIDPSYYFLLCVLAAVFPSDYPHIHNPFSSCEQYRLHIRTLLAFRTVMTHCITRSLRLTRPETFRQPTALQDLLSTAWN